MADDRPGHSPGSFLQSAIVGAPLAVGVGVGVQKMMRDTSFQTAATKENPLVASAAKAKSVAPLPTFNRDAMLRWMRGGRTQDFIRAESNLTQMAWESALSQSDPLAEQRLRSMTNNVPLANLPDAIARAMETEESQGAQKAFSTFRNIMKSGVRQKNLMGTVPRFGKFDPAVPTGRFARLPSNMGDAMARMEKTMGRNAQSMFFGEGSVGTYRIIMPTPVGNLKMQIPTVQKGMLFQGFTQQIKKIAPDVMLLRGGTVERMNRSEYMMHLYERSILPQIGTTITSERDLRTATAAVWEEAVGGLENAPRFTGRGMNRYETIRKHAVDIRVEEELGEKFFKLGVRSPTEGEYADVLRRQGLFGGASPTSMAKGRAMEKDISRWFTTPKAVDWSARIDQMNRKWFLTQEAQNFIKNDRRLHLDGLSQEQLSIFDTKAFRKDFGQYSSAQFSTLYMDPSIARNVRPIDTLRIGEGEALMHPRVKGALASQTSTTAQLRPTEGLEARIAQHLETGDVFKEGEMLGITTKGKPFLYDPSKMELLGSSAHTSPSKGGYLGVHYLEQAPMEQYGKVFGDIKAVLRFEKRKIMQTGVDIIATTDDLRKSPHRHNKQMLSRLWYYTKRQWETGKIERTARMQKFMETYHSLGNEMMGRARIKMTEGPFAGQRVYQHREMVRGLMDVATKEMKLTPEAFGSVFGAAPAVLGEDAVSIAQEVGASASQIRVMQQGRARGFAGIMFDQPMKYGGAGRKATVEPRGLEILRSGILGDLGVEAAEDFSMRQALTSPEKVATHEALTQTLMSTIGELKAPEGAPLYDLTGPLGKTGTYTKAGFESFIQKGGGFIRPGHGQADIFVPGPDVTAAMRSFKNEAGRTIEGSLSAYYHDIAKSAANLQSNVYGPGDYTQDLEKFQRDIYKQWAPSGKGMGAITRGKTLGSRYERAVSTLGRQAPVDMNEVLISQGQATGMLREMKRSGLYGQEAMAAMEERLLGGQQVGAWLGRDPEIGPYSYQPVNVRAVRGHATAIAIPEMKLGIGVAGEETTKAIQISRAVGLALDKDADNAAIILAGPDQEKTIRNTLARAENEFTQGYAQHQVRMGLLKAGKATASDMPTTLKMIAETQKLRTLEAWVPKLSVQLTEAKRAAARHLTGQQLNDAMFLAEFIEQKAIGAKHLAAGDVAEGAVSRMMGGIIEAFQQRNPENLFSVIEPMIQDDPLSRKMMGEGVTITKGMDRLQREIGLQSPHVPGISMKSTLEAMTGALDKGDVTGSVDDFVTGRAFGGVKNLPENLGRVAAESKGLGEGMMKKVSRAIMSGDNMLASAGKGMMKHWKPIGLGFAATIALSNILSTPPKSVSSSAGRDVVNAHMQMRQQKAADRMHPENVHPPGHAMGNPSVPPMLHQNRVMMSPPGYSTQVQMYGRTRDQLSPSQIFGNIRSVAGNNITGGVNLNDNRSYASQFLAIQGIS